MTTPAFPNGFESWQKTHFEVVEVLVYMRELEEAKDIKEPKRFTEYADRSATGKMYKLALDLTNKYEELTAGKKRDRSLFDEIEEFVWQELKSQ